MRKNVTYSKTPNHAARAAHARGDRAFRTYDTSYIRPKKSKTPAIVGSVVLIALLALIIWLVASFVNGCTEEVTPLAEGETVQIEVVEGSTVDDVAKQLAQVGAVESSSKFKNRVEELGAQDKFQAGTFTIVGGMTFDEIIELLQVAQPTETLTIPEGSTLKQVASIVEEGTKGEVTAEAFLQQASDASAYASEFPFLEEAGTQSLEGFLFPKTYPIESGISADSLIRAMLSQYSLEIKTLDYSKAQEAGLSSYDVLKLASIIEKESDDNHRALVSSVFYNRLNDDMNLQSDATIAYYVGADPTPEDIQKDQPYNTYTNPGLPPTPIDSPGLAALQAACNPEASDYFYFYFAPDDSGTMQYYFSETYEEHESTYQ